MKKAVFGIVSVLLIFIAILTFVSQIQTAEARTIIVPDEYPTIQQAINASSSGDTIYVRAGKYVENLVIDKGVHLIGECRKAIIDGNGTGPVIKIIENGVLIENFTIQNGGPLGNGVDVVSCNYTTIQNNNILNNSQGLCLDHSANSRVCGNSIVGNRANGIYIWFSSNSYVSKNSLINNRILISYSARNLIFENTIINSGIYMEGSNNEIIQNSIINGSGVVLRYYGGNRIIGNNLVNNSIGIHLDVSAGNTIFHNNFVNNSRQAGTTASTNAWDDGYPSGGNYWSDYAGVDEKSGSYQNETGSDGIGDIPYVINQDNVDRYPLMRPWQPTPTYLNGVDVSHWQGNINWFEVYSAGYRFAFVKASESVGWADPNFAANMKNGRDAGLFMGAYHFARPDLGNNPEDEAYYFINVASEYLSEGFLRPVLDLEVGSSLGKEALSNWVRTWMETVKNETGIEPIIYVNSNYANNYLDQSIAHYNLWIAHWTFDPSTSPNTGIWNSWDFWQYSNNGSVPGITGYVDLDLFNGDEEKLNREFKIPNLKVLNVTWEGITYPITISSNSTVMHLVFNQQQAYITLNVSGAHGSKGYCNVTIPKQLLKGPWTFTIEGDVSNIDIQEAENETHSFLYFTYIHASTFLIKIQGAWVVPEYPTAMLPILLLLITTLMVIINKKARKAKDT